LEFARENPWMDLLHAHAEPWAWHTVTFTLKGAAMDDESKELLRRMTQLQAEQTELLKKYLPSMLRRVRFSLLGLLLLMTLVAGGLGFTVWSVRSLKKPAVPTVTLTAPTGYYAPTPAPPSTSATLQLFGNPPENSGFGSRAP
jgi:hypothetical protein